MEQHGPLCDGAAVADIQTCLRLHAEHGVLLFQVSPRTRFASNEGKRTLIRTARVSAACFSACRGIEGVVAVWRCAVAPALCA